MHGSYFTYRLTTPCDRSVVPSAVPASVPFGIRLLALSHARAWPTAAWTGVATALGAGLALGPAEWATLGALVVVCGATVRMTAVHLVGAWLSTRPDGLPPLPAPASAYDAASFSALRAIARVPLVPPTPR